MSPTDASRPCFLTPNETSSSAEHIGHLTVTNKCPEDFFKVALLRIDPAGKDHIQAMGADAGGVWPDTQFVWVGPVLTFLPKSEVPQGKPLYVAVLRLADGKMVAPKGIKADGTLLDVSSSRRRVCQLFDDVPYAWSPKGPTDFAFFNATLSPDGSRVIRNDHRAYPGTRRSESGEPGVPCKEYFEEGHDGRPGVEGRMVDVYTTGSCRVVIDDCMV
jgi:hypothetical protein